MAVTLLHVVVAAAFLVASASSMGLYANKGASTKGQEEIGPIDNFTCTANGAFPHEECDLFVTCWNDAAILHRCTEIQLFDLRYNGCNFARYVDCGNRIRPPTYPPTETPPPVTTTVDPSATTIPTTPPPNSTFECTSNGVFPHAEKCEYYWSCYEGAAQLIHCELNYLFDLVYNGCNFPEYTDCQDRERPIGSSSPSTLPVTSTTVRPTDPGNNSTGTPPSSTTGGGGGQFQCPEPNGQFPDPEDCNGFYSCVGNTPIHENCPEGLHFSPVLQLCDWPATAGCELNKIIA